MNAPHRQGDLFDREHIVREADDSGEDDARWTWGNWVPAQDGEGAKNFWEPAYISPEQARTVRREP